MADIPQITPEIEAEAARNPDGWVYKVDWNYPADQYTPPEAIVGGFQVDGHGRLTGHFEPNPNYRRVIVAARQPQEYMLRKRPAHQCNQWETEIDPNYHHLFPNVPPEGLIGDWYIGANGTITGQFRPNAKYKGDIKT
jgi:hypothetical protein